MYETSRLPFLFNLNLSGRTKMPSQSPRPKPNPVETSPLLQSNQQNTTNTMPNTNTPKQKTSVNTDVDKTTDTTTPAPSGHRLIHPSTDYSWTAPAGLPVRGADDESLLIFRRAVGINSDRATTFADGETLEKGRRHAVGIYLSVIQHQKRKRITHHTFGVLLYVCHFLQIVLAAVLTALGPNAKNYEVVITILGAVNTVTAGVLAVLKGSGVIERLSKDEVEFKKLQDWIEETESLLSVGILGRNRKEVGMLVEVTFKKYNACFGQSFEIMSSSDFSAMRSSGQGKNTASAER